MKDITNPKVLWLKGALFLALGAIASTLLLNDAPGLRNAALLLVAVWAFCRAYYFAFYVLEHYADPAFRYAGLLSLLRYVLQTRRRSKK